MFLMYNLVVRLIVLRIYICNFIVFLVVFVYEVFWNYLNVLLDYKGIVMLSDIMVWINKMLSFFGGC